MSADQLSIMKVVDDRIATSEINRVYAVEGPDFQRYVTLASAGGAGLNLTFNLQPGSPNTGISRTLWVNLAGTTTFTGANLNAATIELGLRNKPLHSCISSMKFTINSSTFTVDQVATIMPALSFYNETAALMNGQLSATAASPDCIAGGLGEGTTGGTVGVNSFGQYNGTVFDPLRPASSSLCGGYVPPSRACLITRIVNSGGNTQLAVSWSICEPLFLSPLMVSNSDEKALFGVNQAQVNITLDSNFINQICCIGFKTPGANAPAVTGVVTDIPSLTSSLEVAFLTPSEDSLKSRPVGLQRYNFTQLQMQNASLATSTLTAAPTPWVPVAVPFTLPAITFSQVPRALVIWAAVDRRSLQTIQAVGEPDWFLPVQSLSVSYGQRNCIMTGLSQRGIWEASCRAGLCCSYPRFAGRPLVNNTGAPATPNQGFWGGAPVILRSQDLNLPEGIVAGAACQTMIQISGTIYNQTNSALDTTLAGAAVNVYCLVIQDGILELKDGSSRNDLISIPMPMIARAKQEREHTADDVLPRSSDSGFTGAGIFKRGGSFWDDVYSGLKQVGSTALRMAPMLLGAGSSGGRRGGQISGGEMSGGEMSGGASMSRSSIRQRLAQLD